MSRRDDWRISSPKELLLALAIVGVVLVIAVVPLAYVVYNGGRLVGLWGPPARAHEVVLAALFVPYLVLLWREHAGVRLVFGALAAAATAAGVASGAWWLVREPSAALPWVGRGLLWLGALVAAGVVALAVGVPLTGRIRERRVRALGRLAGRAPASARALRRGRKVSRRILLLERPGYEDAVDACPGLLEAAREEGPLREHCVAVLARYGTPTEELARLVTGGFPWGGWQETRQAWIRWAGERWNAPADEPAWRAVLREARLRLERTTDAERRLFLERLGSENGDPWSRFGRRFAASVAGLPEEDRGRLEEALTVRPSALT